MCMRFTVRRMMALVLAVSTGMAALVSGSESIAGAVLLLTLGMLAVPVLGIVYRREEVRAFWIGFALLGWGYMSLVLGHWLFRGPDRPAELVTSTVLNRLFLLVPHEQFKRPLPSTAASLLETPDAGDEKIWLKLAMPAPEGFGGTTTLDEIVRDVVKATRVGTGSRIPIYVDPAGIEAAHLTMSVPVSVNVEGGLPLRTALALALGQIGLTFEVHDGMLMITKGTADPAGIESFRRIGHCYCALLAAWFGGLIGRWFHATRDLPVSTVD